MKTSISKETADISMQNALQLSVETIQDSYSELHEVSLLKGKVQLRIDSADSAGLQLLVALILSRRQPGMEVQIVTENSDLSDMIQNLGLASILV